MKGFRVQDLNVLDSWVWRVKGVNVGARVWGLGLEFEGWGF